MGKLNLAVIVGSNRRDSINRKLAHALARLGAGSFEASFPRIDDLPMFNQDLEGNLPAEVVRFKSELARADGVLIVTPEHDRSIPALLKNAVDWGARPYGKNSWAGKPAFITGTSPGAIGSALAQHHLRSIMVGLGATLLGGLRHFQAGPDQRPGQHRRRRHAAVSARFYRSVRDPGPTPDITGVRTLGGVAAGELTSPPPRG
jgi:chromate reductase, NAD(P)H dehydrogenase (quinone)